MFRSMFGPITIRVHGPGQAIIIVLFAVGINLNVSGSQFFPRRVQVIYGGAACSRVSTGNTVSSKLCRCEGTLAR
jgi:hypothetical protein